MIRTLHEGLLADGIAVPLTKLCAEGRSLFCRTDQAMTRPGRR